MFTVFYNSVGAIGVILCLIAFFLIQTHRITAKHLGYILLNLCGSALIIFSLCFAWNLPSFMVEICWLLISLLGLYQYWKNRHDAA